MIGSGGMRKWECVRERGREGGRRVCGREVGER